MKYIYRAIFCDNNFFKKEYFHLKIKQLYLKSEQLKALKRIAALSIKILNLNKFIINFTRS